MQKGSISVQTENIFPIIKQYLYSDQEIFLRELVSNAVDATTKVKTLSSKGEAKGELGDLTIQVALDKEAKTLTISDKGIGMSEAEVLKYLNQVAFSSAHEFLEKHKGDATIIGNFGLGFYSAFMVSSRVEVITKSYRSEEPAVKWTCDGSPEYTLESAEKVERGTDIILHISEDSNEFLEESRIQELLNKYCHFLPVAIQFGTRTDSHTEGEGDDEKTIETEVPNIINNTAPAWKKAPTDLTDEDYKAFYQELYPYSPEPMFWIHLNIDYPFNLTGILFFPKLNNTFEVQKNKIQLYSNQVYVTDNVKEIVPEFLTLLQGVIDSPDIPLNVSRSYLQSDSNVRKITGYITKKVAEKLEDLFKKDRALFEERWPDLGPFVKYGILSDEKFQDKAMAFALLKNTGGAFHTLEEYKELVKENQTDKHNRIVCLYTHDATAHDAIVQDCVDRGYHVLVLDHVIDSHFIQHIEYKGGNVTFVRVDSDTIDQLVQKETTTESLLSEDQSNQIKEVFETIAGKPSITVSTKAMSPNDQPVVITRPEFLRRMREMQSIQNMGGAGNDFLDMYNVVVNTNHPIVVEKLANAAGEARQELATYLYQLAMLNQGMLTGSDMTRFVKRSLEMVGK